MEGEAKGAIRATSINTITFYSGKLSKEKIRLKLNAIIAANPWLLTRLVNSKEFGDVCALYPEQFDPLSDSHSCFQTLIDDSISPSVPYEDLLLKLKVAIVPQGIECLDKDFDQFKVTLIEIKPDQEYALVVSMSHTIADGHTFYQVYSMLDKGVSVAALEFRRRQDFIDVFRDICGQRYYSWLISPCFIVGILRTMLSLPLPSVTGFSVDKTAIDAAKRANSTALPKDKFLSTNDILTQWFFRLCGRSHGMMAFNFRGRIPTFSNSLAGNYEAMMLFSEKEFASPIGIRESLTTFNKDVRHPTAWETMDFNIPVVTNWSSFFADVHLEDGAVPTLHFPLISTVGCLFRDMCVWCLTPRKAH